MVHSSGEWPSEHQERGCHVQATSRREQQELGEARSAGQLQPHAHRRPVGGARHEGEHQDDADDAGRVRRHPGVRVYRGRDAQAPGHYCVRGEDRSRERGWGREHLGTCWAHPLHHRILVLPQGPMGPDQEQQGPGGRRDRGRQRPGDEGGQAYPPWRYGNVPGAELGRVVPEGGPRAGAAQQGVHGRGAQDVQGLGALLRAVRPQR
mmetsp:Transcript_109603/g.305491  ORF Transcript_109603/g.305491 Transcript_109603/m.305491 type:complete len:207 (+) Transcript_109603:393-1013(+)